MLKRRTSRCLWGKERIRGLHCVYALFIVNQEAVVVTPCRFWRNNKIETELIEARGSHGTVGRQVKGNGKVISLGIVGYRDGEAPV